MLFNHTCNFVVFPDCLETPKVIPVLKGGDSSEISNYWPISIVSIFSEMFEKLIAIWMHTFLDKQSILMPTQYWFRPMHSSLHAMLDLLTSTFDNINQNKDMPCCY